MPRRSEHTRFLNCTKTRPVSMSERTPKRGLSFTVLAAVFVFALVLLSGCGRSYKHPEGIDTQRADDMDACWNEAEEYVQKFHPDQREEEHETFFHECMLLRGYKK